MRLALKKLLKFLCRVLFVYECRGQQHIPLTGPAVIASNHPSYLDPILLSLEVRRPIRFMAWEALFGVPIVGWLIRSLGAFPVDPRRGKGRAAYEKAKGFVQSGKVVGIFPEGKRSRTGWMEPSLRAGAARLAWETGAPLIPATITGAYRAWPHFRSLPRPAHIRVRFHPPIDPAPYRALPEEQALPAMLEELRRHVERSLLPGVKADLRIGVLYRLPAPRPRAHELILVSGSALLLLARTRSLASLLVPASYLLYLMLDRPLIPQRRLVKWLRNTSPLLLLLGFGPALLRTLGLPAVPAGRALAASLLGALAPYFYERSSTAVGFVRGLVAAACLELAALHLVPTGIGPHVALPVFAAAYAWEKRTVFWRYAAPVLAGYALVACGWMGGGMELLPHATAGLLAWVMTQVLPYSPPGPQRDEPIIEGLGLGPQP